VGSNALLSWSTPEVCDLHAGGSVMTVGSVNPLDNLATRLSGWELVAALPRLRLSFSAHCG
jgi:hypothetical protein